MPADKKLDMAARALFTARQMGRQIAVDTIEELSTDEALGLQLDVLERFTAAGQSLGGWKAGLTSGAGRDALGAGFRPFGYILESRILANRAHIPLAIPGLTIEPEICLTIGEELGGANPDIATVRGAVCAVAPALEVNERRFNADAGMGLILADGLSNWGIVVGPEIPAGNDLTDFAVEFGDESETFFSARAGAMMDNPYLAISRLCAALDAFGLNLLPGQRVITGAFGQHRVAGPGTFRANFQHLGEVCVTVTDHPLSE